MKQTDKSALNLIRGRPSSGRNRKLVSVLPWWLPAPKLVSHHSPLPPIIYIRRKLESETEPGVNLGSMGCRCPGHESMATVPNACAFSLCNIYAYIYLGNVLWNSVNVLFMVKLKCENYFFKMLLLLDIYFVIVLALWPVFDNSWHFVKGSICVVFNKSCCYNKSILCIGGSDYQAFPKHLFCPI